MTDFITSESFPTKKQWKRIVNEVVQRKEDLAWSEKLNQNSVLKLYMQAHQHLSISFLYEIWGFCSNEFKYRSRCDSSALWLS
jgi:hypothetical protein